jgi:hypothetical protein
VLVEREHRLSNRIRLEVEPKGLATQEVRLDIGRPPKPMSEILLAFESQIVLLIERPNVYPRKSDGQ